jgi:uncharacterized protein (TIGR02246 family)
MLDLMTRRFLSSFALAALLVAGSGVPSTARTSRVDDRAAVAALGERWNALYAAGDWTAMRGLYADDAWLMTDNAPAAKGAEAIIAYLRRYRDLGATVNFRFVPEDIRIDGRMATVVSKYWMTAQMPGRPEVRTAGRSMLVYRKTGGRWLLWRDMDNRTPDVIAE